MPTSPPGRDRPRPTLRPVPEVRRLPADAQRGGPVLAPTPVAPLVADSKLEWLGETGTQGTWVRHVGIFQNGAP